MQCAGRIRDQTGTALSATLLINSSKAGPRTPANRMRRTSARRLEVTQSRLRAFRRVRHGQEETGKYLWYLWAKHPAAGAAASTTSRLSHPVSPRLPRRAARPRRALLLLHVLLQRPARKRPSPHLVIVLPRFLTIVLIEGRLSGIPGFLGAFGCFVHGGVPAEGDDQLSAAREGKDETAVEQLV
jgi:hypothetical protein